MKKIDEIINFNENVAYIDVEATNNLRILQISCVVANNNGVVKQYNRFSNPNCYSGKRVLKLINKNQSFFNRFNSNEVVFKEFYDFIKNYKNIISYGNFDQKIIDIHCKINNLNQIKIFDFQDYICKNFTEQNIYPSLMNLTTIFKIKKEYNFHNSLADAFYLFKIINKIRKINDLKSIKDKIYNSLIVYKKYQYKKIKYESTQKIQVKYNENYKIIYVNLDIKYHNINYKNTKLIKTINMQIVVINNKGKFVVKHIYKNDFKINQQEKASKYKEKIINNFITKYMNNSILIYENNIGEIIDYFYKKFNYLPQFYYIPIKNLIFLQNVYFQKNIPFYIDDKLIKAILKTNNDWVK